MSADTKKRGLGRGLDALFRDVREEEESFAPKVKRADEMVSAAQQMGGAELQPIEFKSKNPPASKNDPVRMVAVDRLEPGRFQPRRLFSEQGIDELAESIATYGVLQPLFVRPLPGGGSVERFEIIGGERRWRAAQKAQLHEVPVIIRALDDKQALEIGLIENLQRADLTPLEEAEGYQRLVDDFAHTQDSLAQQLGKSRSHIANLLRLLKLPESVRNLIQQGALSAGHARALIGSDKAAELAGIIVARGLSVRQAEALAKSGIPPESRTPKKRGGGIVKKDVDILSLERKMTALLGLNVSIEGQGASGRLVVEYESLEQLDDLLARLSAAPGG